jgi:two-component system phosphate regulon response regulator PhoB
MNKKDKQKKFVLVAEAEQTFGSELCNRLIKAGYEARKEIDGVKAHAAIQSRLPDAIVLDCILPGIRGLEFLKMLKSTSKTKNIPVIFICETNDNEMVKSGEQVGAAKAIRKSSDAISQIVMEVTRQIQTR